MQFDATLKIGDLLTSASVLVAATALIVAWWKDRSLRRRELADKIRRAAGNTLARLERWQEIVLALFDDAQPLFVEVAQDLVGKYDVTAARDKVWRELNRLRLALRRELRSEEIETAYVDLYTYHPAARDNFRDAIRTIRLAEEKAFRGFLQGTQDAILSFEGKEAAYETAELGNRLRETATDWKATFDLAIEQATMPLQAFLVSIMWQSDGETLRREKAVPNLGIQTCAEPPHAREPTVRPDSNGDSSPPAR